MSKRERSLRFTVLNRMLAMLMIASVFFTSARFNVQAATPVAATSSSAQVLILYDAAAGQYKKLGMVYAIMLSNLLGHFNLKADLQPVDAYTAGEINSYQTVFYLGTSYDNPVPAAFLSDVAAHAEKRVVWFKYNLWQYAWDATYNFTTKYGFNFQTLRGLNSAPSSTTPNPGFFNTIPYKNRSLVKYYSYDATTNTVKADPDFGMTQILDASKATALVNANNPSTGEVAPYIIRSGNFWYFADLPLSYIGPRDRYLVLCDILHDVLGINHPEIHRAMVRLEDVSANVDPNAMKQLTDYLYGQRIPFSIATIPFYRDPLGYYNGGVPEEVHLKDATDLLTSLNYATARGGSINIHGYTHQYSNLPNLHTAVSADDFEFWYATENRPVNEDSQSWAAQRMQAAKDELSAQNFKFFAFEPPHYQASPYSYKAMQQLFPDAYERAVYYTSDTPNDLNSTANDHNFSAGMFYPYVISSDYYGQRIMPENLGNIEYNISYIDPFSNVTYTADDLLENANDALVVRDGFASFFFHPFWIEPSLSNLNAFDDFKRTVQGITALNYQWIGMPDLIITVTAVTPNTGKVNTSTAVTISGRDFEPGARVFFGSAEATNVNVISPTTITCLTSSAKRGSVNVVVTNLDGRSSTLSKGFTYK